MSLVDQHSGLVDALGLESLLVDPCLQSLVQEFVEGQPENVIEFEFLIGQQPVPVHSIEQGGSFKESPGVFFFKGEKLSGGFSELGQ